jgi:hemerythrin-like domain-containing protein
MAKDAVDFITEDHVLMREVLEQLRTADESSRQELVEKTGAMLRAHSHAEEQHVYPALEVVGQEEGEEVHHSAEEHHEAEALLSQLEACPIDSSEFPRLAQEFVESVLHHMDEEETSVLPSLRQTVDEKTLQEMGEAFEEQRKAEMSQVKS